MSTTIFERRRAQDKELKRSTSYFKNPRTIIQQHNSVKKLTAVLQELVYGRTKDEIEKKLAQANKQWMKNFYNHLK